MKRFKASLLSRRGSKKDASPRTTSTANAANEANAPQDDSPEGNAGRGVRLFCESGGPNSEEEEVLHLPVIVEAAESSPLAAREAAMQIRQFLGKENNERPHVQYNAVMLIRILADNPGPTFTRSLDVRFAGIVKDLLRNSHDPSVQQILRETLETFATEKNADDGLRPLLDMWQREKSKPRPLPGPVSPPHFPGPSQAFLHAFPNTQQASDLPPSAHLSRHLGPLSTDPSQQQNYFARSHRNRGLPSPTELASRIEEARISAKLLLQVVQSTPASEILNNELIAEFAQRCQSASRSIQGYIHSDNPAPDDDTLLTLIETNEQLSTAMSKHQRAVLQARKLLASRSGSGPGYQMTPSPGAASNGTDPFTDDNRVYHQGPPPDTGFGISYNVPASGQAHIHKAGAPPGNGYSESQYVPSNGPSAAQSTRPSVFSPLSQPAPEQPVPKDESFRLTLPSQPHDSVSSPPTGQPSDPRWSWSQRMSTQTGYESGQAPSPPPPPPAQGVYGQGGYSARAERGPAANAQQFYQRQESAVPYATMRGAVPIDGHGHGHGQGLSGLGIPGSGEAAVSPVSPVDVRGQGKLNRI